MVQEGHETGFQKRNRELDNSSVYVSVDVCKHDLSFYGENFPIL